MWGQLAQAPNAGMLATCFRSLTQKNDRKAKGLLSEPQSIFPTEIRDMGSSSEAISGKVLNSKRIIRLLLTVAPKADLGPVLSRA